MRRLRTLSTRRLAALAAAVAAIALTAGIARAALGGSGPTPPAKPLDHAVAAALAAPAVQGISARITFKNGLLPAGALPQGSASPIATGAKGRLWLAQDGRFRLELQSNDAGDAQIVSDGTRLTVYDAASNTLYRAQLPAHHEQKAHRPPGLAAVRDELAQLARDWTLSGAQPGNTAGQPSYRVRIEPKDQGGLLGAAELAWDARHGVPLRAAVYAQGQADPVLELAATDVSYGSVPAADLTAPAPAGAKVVDLNPGTHSADRHRHADVHGAAAVQRRLDFQLAAPAELAGLPREDVHLVQMGDRKGALVTYGQGLGGIAVLESKAEGSGKPAPEARLPQVNIDGATGTELATALGTVVTFQRSGVEYVVLGSVPPVAAENAARGLG